MNTEQENDIYKKYVSDMLERHFIGGYRDSLYNELMQNFTLKSFRREIVNDERVINRADLKVLREFIKEVKGLRKFRLLKRQWALLADVQKINI